MRRKGDTEKRRSVMINHESMRRDKESNISGKDGKSETDGGEAE